MNSKFAARMIATFRIARKSHPVGRRRRGDKISRLLTDIFTEDCCICSHPHLAHRRPQPSVRLRRATDDGRVLIRWRIPAILL